jgi:hypothetical protein
MRIYSSGFSPKSSGRIRSVTDPHPDEWGGRKAPSLTGGVGRSWLKSRLAESRLAGTSAGPTLTGMRLARRGSERRNVEMNLDTAGRAACATSARQRQREDGRNFHRVARSPFLSAITWPSRVQPMER